MMEYLKLSFLALVVLCALVEGKDNSRCTIYQGGCAFHVVLAGSDCMAGDAPAQSYGYNNYKKDPPSIQYGYQLSSTGPANGMENKLLKEHILAENSKETLQEELKSATKRFEELEKKLTNLMEGLSVRSLRHFRKIKSEIKQVKSTVDELKENGKKEKDSRSERSSKKQCPPEYVTTGTWNSCYSFSKFEADWRDAREYCLSSGADLVALESMKEAYILDYLLKSNADTELSDTWWTSGNYIPRSQRWMWATHKRMRPIVYARWAENEPNSRSTNHCMVLHKNTEYHWQDAMCTDQSRFICEIDMKR